MSRSFKTLFQALRFTAVSGVALAIDAAIYAILISQFDVSGSWAKRLSFACVAFWGYFANKHFTFRDKSPNGSEPMKFALLYLTGGIINSVIHDLAAVQDEATRPAFIAATFAWACWNFIGQKFYVFRNGKKL